MGWGPAKLYRIKFASDERRALEEIRDQGTQKARKFKRALSFLLSDEGRYGPAMKNADIVATTGLSYSSLERFGKRCCEVGLLAALDPIPREKGPREIKITGEVEAHITRLACAHWFAWMSLPNNFSLKREIRDLQRREI